MWFAIPYNDIWTKNHLSFPFHYKEDATLSSALKRLDNKDYLFWITNIKFTAKVHALIKSGANQHFNDLLINVIF